MSGTARLDFHQRENGINSAFLKKRPAFPNNIKLSHPLMLDLCSSVPHQSSAISDPFQKARATASMSPNLIPKHLSPTLQQSQNLHPIHPASQNLLPVQQGQTHHHPGWTVPPTLLYARVRAEGIFPSQSHCKDLACTWSNWDRLQPLET